MPCSTRRHPIAPHSIDKPDRSRKVAWLAHPLFLPDKSGWPYTADEPIHMDPGNLSLRTMMTPVVQEEVTGCGIASVAAVAGVSYQHARRLANSMGIHAEDTRLWSETAHVRFLLRRFGVRASTEERPFTAWRFLPDLALLSIKWHREGGRPFWHWVVFVRENGRAYVLDSKKSLRTHTRTDFGRMKPKWYIALRLDQPAVQRTRTKAVRAAELGR